MHKMKDYENPGLPLGNPYSYHFIPSQNIESERGHQVLWSPLLDSSFDPEDGWMKLNEQTPGRDRDQSVHPAPSEDHQSSDVLLTPPHHPPSPFVPASSTSRPYDWLYVDPDLDF